MVLKSAANMKAAKQATDAIERQLVKDRLELDREVKLLLLGAGGCGKSTIFKQMQLIYGAGYTDDERATYTKTVRENVVATVKAILHIASELSSAQPPAECFAIDPMLVETVGSAVDRSSNQIWDKDFVLVLNTVLKNSTVQNILSRSTEFQLPDSTQYYLAKLDEIAQPDYLPNDQDILRSRTTTIGIIEKHYKVQDWSYKIVDVGGQRSQRRKWLHCFENVMGVIFVAALSEYDQVLEEDKSMNRMKESLLLFGSICNSKWLTKSPCILFLNKLDIFEQKLKTTSPQKFFPDFPEKYKTVAQAQQFFKGLFLEANMNPSKSIYTHFTCATDTKQIQIVLAAVGDIMTRNLLGGTGMI